MKTVFFLSLALYGAALAMQLLGALLRREGLRKTAWVVYLLGFAAHLAYFIWRGIVAQRLPLSSQFEFACGFALCIPVVLALLRKRMDLNWIASAGMGATVLVQGYAAFQRMEINALMPALRSFWFNFHIGAAALSYSAFLVAACVAGRYVYQHRRGEPGDSLKMLQLEDLSFKLTALGYLLLTVVIVIGAVWAEARGGYGVCPPTAVQVCDTSGAGDAFCAGVSIGLSYGKTLAESCVIGTRLASATITVPESVCPRFQPQELGLEPGELSGLL